MSWLTRILPYVDQEPLWNATVGAYAAQPSPYINPPHVGFAIRVAMFVCPTDSRGFQPQTTHQGRVVALTSYIGVLGEAYDSTEGVLFRDSLIRLTDITDGTSNTLAVGERPASADRWYGWWYAGYGQDGTGSADMLLGVRERNFGGPYVSMCPSGPYHFQAGQFGRQCDLFHYWSPHPGGGHFLFADGSVHFLSSAIAQMHCYRPWRPVAAGSPCPFLSEVLCSRNARSRREAAF